MRGEVPILGLNGDALGQKGSRYVSDLKDELERRVISPTDYSKLEGELGIILFDLDREFPSTASNDEAAFRLAATQLVCPQRVLFDRITRVIQRDCKTSRDPSSVSSYPCVLSFFLVTSGRVRGGAIRRGRGVNSAGEVRGKWAGRRGSGVNSARILNLSLVSLL